MVGGTVSLTMMSVEQIVTQVLLVIRRSNEKLVPQFVPATTVTFWELVEPVIAPLPVIDQE